MQNLSATCRVLYNEFPLTEREYHNRLANLKKEAEIARKSAQQSEDARLRDERRLRELEDDHHDIRWIIQAFKRGEVKSAKAMQEIVDLMDKYTDEEDDVDIDRLMRD